MIITRWWSWISPRIFVSYSKRVRRNPHCWQYICTCHACRWSGNGWTSCSRRGSCSGSTSCSRRSTSSCSIRSFTLSKTYSAFRTLGHQLKKLADEATEDNGKKPPVVVVRLAQYCETVLQLVESQRTQYLGKVRLKIQLAVWRETMVSHLFLFDPKG